MRRQLILAAAGGIAVMSLSTLALAEMSLPYGWYLEGNIGSTTAGNKTYGTNTSSSTSGVGQSAMLGYKFMPYLTTELGYSNYARTNISNSAGVKIARDRRGAFNFSFKGIIPAGSTGFEAFAKAGVSRLSSSVSIEDSTAAAAAGVASGSHSATGLYVGAGVQFYFMPELAMVLQWTRADGSKSTGNMELLSAGLSFIFG